MRIDNIVVSNKDIKKLTATVSFDIIDIADNTKVLIKINDKEYSQLSAKETKTSVSYNIKGLQRGINNINIKLVGTDEEYISEPFLIKLKYNPSIEGLVCSYSDSTGKFILDFTIVGDELFTYDVDFKLDEDDYSNIMTCQIQGEKSYESVSIMGNHSCKLKVTDGYDIYETDVFSFEIVNQKPILSRVLVTNITNNGTASIHYAVKDIENSVLEHKLNLGGEDIVINPNKSSAFCTYELSNLTMGIHTCYISVDDGIDTVKSENFTIEIFEDTTDRKGILKQAKDKYDFAYQSLKEIILSVVSDGIFDYDIENAIIQKAQEYYIEMYSEFNRIAQQSIDIIGTNKVTVTKQDLELQINDVDTAITNLGNTMETTFKDGILTDTEKDILRNNLDLVAKEKSDIDKDYEALYSNEDLLDPTKTNLLTSYNSFVEAHNNLVLGVDDLINKIGIIDDNDKNNVSALFEAWRTALGNYRTRSLESIDAIAKKKADDSADSVDKKWAEIILDPESGIQAQVGSLSETVGGFDERISTVEVTANGVSTTVSSMQSTVSGFDKRITNAESKVTQLDNKISSSVTEDDVKSIIEQSPNEIRYGFNDICDYVTISTSGLTVNRGAVACDLLTTPPGHEPVINLFTLSGHQCQIDARKSPGGTFGEALRLKFDDDNYYFISDNSATIYQHEEFSFIFKTNETYRDISEIITPNGILRFDGSNSYDYFDSSNNRLYFDGVPVVMQGGDAIKVFSIGGGDPWFRGTNRKSGIFFSSDGGQVGVYALKNTNSPTSSESMFTFYWGTNGVPTINGDGKSLGFLDGGLYYQGKSIAYWSDCDSTFDKKGHTHSGYSPSSHTHGSTYAPYSHSHSYYGSDSDAYFSNVRPTSKNDGYCGSPYNNYWYGLAGANLWYSWYSSSLKSLSVSSSDTTEEMNYEDISKNALKMFFGNFREIVNNKGEMIRTFDTRSSTNDLVKEMYDSIFVENDDGVVFAQACALSSNQSDCLSLLIQENEELTNKINTLEERIKELENKLK